MPPHMAEHWYWVAECLTEGCSALQVLKHIGPSSAWDGLSPLDIAFPASPIRMKCPTCQQVGDYDIKDVHPMSLPQAPPPGYTDQF